MGSIKRLKSFNGHKPVHPHVRGEHPTTPPNRAGAAGSSPRAWGACHRGAKLCRDTGSSPRAWGASDAALAPLFAPRFIPTCVGSIRASCGRPGADTVHPHVRGEHYSSRLTPLRAVGSSPRAWGASNLDLFRRLHQRFIPHVRGRHSRTKVDKHQIVGSSHVRGEHRSSIRSSGIGERFIPTCVGSMSQASRRAETGSVHPHVRGEHVTDSDHQLGHGGLSPRAWGACMVRDGQ